MISVPNQKINHRGLSAIASPNHRSSNRNCSGNGIHNGGMTNNNPRGVLNDNHDAFGRIHSRSSNIEWPAVKHASIVNNANGCKWKSKC